jgi:hypothetical protein
VVEATLLSLQKPASWLGHRLSRPSARLFLVCAFDWWDVGEEKGVG